MRLFPLTLILTCLAVPLAHAQATAPATPSAAAADSVAVVRAVAAYDDAWSAKDTAAVSRWLAPAYRYFSSLGGVSSRRQVLDQLAEPAYRVEYAERSAIELSVVGATAVVGSRWRGRGTYSGGRFDDDQRCSLVLVKQRAGWRLVAEHCTQIVADPT